MVVKFKRKDSCQKSKSKSKTQSIINEYMVEYWSIFFFTKQRESYYQQGTRELDHHKTSQKTHEHDSPSLELTKEFNHLQTTFLKKVVNPGTLLQNAQTTPTVHQLQTKENQNAMTGHTGTNTKSRGRFVENIGPTFLESMPKYVVILSDPYGT